MSRFTFLRVEVDSAVVERALGLTPGVEVVESFDADERESSADGSIETPETTTRTVDDSDGEDGLLERAKPDGDLLEEGSPVRKYGLLAAGVSFVLLGVATIGIWVYRRRSGGSEPASPAEFDAPGTEPTAVDADTEADIDTGGERDDAPLSIVRDEVDADEAAESEAPSEPAAAGGDDEPRGRTEDREGVEWTTKWETEPRPSEAESEEADVSEPEADEPRASESVDVAPLLGVAFVAVTGVVVRWVRGGDEE